MVTPSVGMPPLPVAPQSIRPAQPVSAVLPPLQQASAQAINNNGPLQSVAPVAYYYPQAAMAPTATQPVMMPVPGLPYPVQMMPPVAPSPRKIEVGEAVGTGEKEIGINPKKFASWLPRPENFNWLSNAAAGSIIGTVLVPMLNYFFQTDPKKQELVQYAGFVGSDGANYRMYFDAPWKPKGLLPNVAKITTDHILGLDLNDAKPNLITKEQKFGPFNLFTKTVPVASFDRSGREITHLNPQGTIAKKVTIGANQVLHDFYNEAGEAVSREVYTKAEQGLAGKWRLSKLVDLSSGQEVVKKAYTVAMDNGEAKLKETVYERAGELFGKVNKELQPIKLLREASDWMAQVPKTARFMAEATPLHEIIQKIWNPRYLFLGAALGGIFAAWTGVNNQPHHTVIRMGE